MPTWLNIVLLPCGQLSACDEELAGMEDMLGRFKGDLGAIGADIRQLQEQSAAMSVRLKNRQAAEQRLASFLDSLALPPALITTIVRVRIVGRVSAVKRYDCSA